MDGSGLDKFIRFIKFFIVLLLGLFILSQGAYFLASRGVSMPEWLLRNKQQTYLVNSNKVNLSDIHCRKGHQYLNSNNYARAREEFMTSLGYNYKNDSAYLGLGKLYIKTGGTDYAMDSLKQAIKFNSKNKEALILLAELHRKNGNKKMAEKYFKLAKG